MVDCRETAVLEAASSADNAMDELDVARAVYGAYVTQTMVGERPSQRVRAAAAFLGMEGVRVRRYLSLHLAPSEIKAHFVAGKLGARIVEMLQGISTPNQLILARRLIERREGATAHHLVAGEVAKETVAKSWSEEALTFEAALLRAIDIVDPYLDAPRGRLMSIFRGAGSTLGRRSLIALLDDHIELLTTLKQTLESYRGDRQEKINGTRSLSDSS
jgi:hypothetical protein